MALILFGSFACPRTILRFPKISHTVHALRTRGALNGGDCRVSHNARILRVQGFLTCSFVLSSRSLIRGSFTILLQSSYLCQSAPGKFPISGCKCSSRSPHEFPTAL
jgi:hypothetical protein